MGLGATAGAGRPNGHATSQTTHTNLEQSAATNACYTLGWRCDGTDSDIRTESARELKNGITKKKIKLMMPTQLESLDYDQDAATVHRLTDDPSLEGQSINRPIGRRVSTERQLAMRRPPGQFDPTTIDRQRRRFH